jgi:hypothetical protein
MQRGPPKRLSCHVTTRCHIPEDLNINNTDTRNGGSVKWNCVPADCRCGHSTSENSI